jgi:hypothetical protein
MIKISKAFKVAKDDKTIHTQHNALAEAFNTRILSGLGDCAWRIFYYAYSTFRGVRNPDGDAYPAQDEWFKFYGYLEPKAMYGKFGWPEAPAGEAQGANVANPFMAWIFGNNTRVKKIDGTSDNTKDRIHGLWSEPVRLGGLEAQPPRPSETEGPIYRSSGHPRLSQVWYDSEIQRGCCAYIPNYTYTLPNGQRAQKVVQLLSLGITGAARRHLRYVMETASMGRYAPSYVPDKSGKGGIFRKKNAVKDQIDQAMFYYLSFFRGTEDQRASHNKISPNVRDNGFNFETFFSQQFLLAPNYSEPKYELDQSGNIKKDQFGNGVVKYDNIGYPELFPQSPSFYWNVPVTNPVSNTFVPCSSSVDQQFKDYDNFSFTSSSGPFFNTNPENSFNKFCLAALFIQTSDIASTTDAGAAELLSGLSIDVYLDKKFYVGIPIGPESRYPVNKRTGAVNNRITGGANQYQIYQFNKIYYFQYPVKGKVSFKVRSTTNNGLLNVGKKIVDGSTFTLNNFSIFLKLAHVFEMKPTVADAYVLMRVATTEGQGEDAGQMDPVGHFNGEMCKTVFSNYYKFGVAYTLRQDASLYQNIAYVSANPVYESIRKFISSNIKMADRVTLIDYEVDEEGKSALYFLRFAYGMKNSGVDIFRGLGPSITPVGNRNIKGSKTEQFIPIVKGKKYIVLDSSAARDGFVLYRTSDTKVEKYTHTETFIGGDYYYISKHSNDTVGVYEIEGITSSDLISKTPKLKIKPDNKNLQYSNGNVSNEWAMFMSYNLYHWSNSSAWKPAMYGDIMGALNGRCLTASDSLEYNRGTSKNVKKHLANVTWKPNDIPLVVEAPPGYTYIEGANTDLSKSGSADPNYALNFASSCPIYKSPYSIESAVRVNPFDPNCEVIKVTLNTRLTASKVNGAVPSFKGKVSENLADFINKANAFQFRTDESAVIDYVLHTIANRSCPRNIVGDVSLDNRQFWTKQRPFGCCYPRFYFVKLIPKVSADTVMYSDHYTQMEYYLRAMCNGFVNNSTELSPEDVQRIVSENETGIDYVGGYDSAVGDYLFEDLMRKSYDISTSNYIPIPPSASIKQ